MTFYSKDPENVNHINITSPPCQTDLLDYYTIYLLNQLFLERTGEYLDQRRIIHITSGNPIQNTKKIKHGEREVDNILERRIEDINQIRSSYNDTKVKSKPDLLPIVIDINDDIRHYFCMHSKKIQEIMMNGRHYHIVCVIRNTSGKYLPPCNRLNIDLNFTINSFDLYNCSPDNITILSGCSIDEKSYSCLFFSREFKQLANDVNPVISANQEKKIKIHIPSQCIEVMYH
jgi:hypothetical protein